MHVRAGDLHGMNLTVQCGTCCVTSCPAVQPRLLPSSCCPSRECVDRDGTCTAGMVQRARVDGLQLHVGRLGGDKR